MFRIIIEHILESGCFLSQILTKLDVAPNKTGGLTDRSKLSNKILFLISCDGTYSLFLDVNYELFHSFVVIIRFQFAFLTKKQHIFATTITLEPWSDCRVKLLLNGKSWDEFILKTFQFQTRNVEEAN